MDIFEDLFSNFSGEVISADLNTKHKTGYLEVRLFVAKSQ